MQKNVIKIVKNLYEYKVITFQKNCTNCANFSNDDKYDLLNNFLSIQNLTEYSDRNYISESGARAKRAVIEYGLNNVWSHFFTITFDIDKIDRYDYDLCLDRIRKFFKNINHYNPSFKYILIPELHSKKNDEEKAAIHFHGLIYTNDISSLNFLCTDKKTKYDIYVDSVLFNLFGANRFIPINDCTESVVYYITKYISKGDPIFKYHYYASRGLKKNEVIATSEDDDYIMYNFEKILLKVTPNYSSTFCTIYNVHESIAELLLKNTSYYFDKRRCV